MFLDLHLKESKIHGIGLFTKQEIPPNSIILITGQAFENNSTVHQKFINHSTNYNINPTKEQDKIILKSTRQINKGEEILLDYSHLLQYGITDTWYLSQILHTILQNKETKLKLENNILHNK